MGASESTPAEDNPASSCTAASIPSPNNTFSSSSSHAPPSPPVSPFALLTKSHLLNLLFDAIDVRHQSYLDRTEIVDFLHHEPYLSSPHIHAAVTSVLHRLQHDEDSHCSRHEFHAAFDGFPPHDITRLIVNLVRAMPLPGRRLRRKLTMLETQLVRGHGEGTDDPADGDRAMATFLLDLLFHTIDADLDGLIEGPELDAFVHQDAFFLADDQPGHSIAALHAALQSSRESRPPRQPAPVPVRPTATAAGSGVTQADFVAAFSALSLEALDAVFLHLLTRCTSDALHESGNAQRHARKTVEHRALMDRVMQAHVPAHDQEPVQLIHGGEHRAARAAESPLHAGSRVQHGIVLTLLGQSMIQHDLHDSPYGSHTLHSIPPHLTADVTFTELETSITPSQPANATRSTVFLHTAPPVVLDCLVELGANVIALANNHAGDMGKEGVAALVEEVRKRGLTAAGVGSNLEEATAPAYLTVTPRCRKGREGGECAGECPRSIRVALVAHASKVPPGSEATDTSAGVSCLSMSDLDTYTLNETDVRRILTAVSIARQHASVVIAYQHNHYWTGNGAVNEEHAMGNWKREWAHALIDSGATVYVSHGDPRLQGIEVYNGAPLFYCLGSLIFQTKTEVGFYGPEVWQSAIATLEYHTDAQSTPQQASDAAPRDRELDQARRKAERTAPVPSDTFSIRLTPLTLNEVGVPAAPPEVHLATRGLPRPALGEEGRRILRHIEEMSREFGTRVEIEEGEGGLVVGWVTAGACKVKADVKGAEQVARKASGEEEWTQVENDTSTGSSAGGPSGGLRGAL